MQNTTPTRKRPAPGAEPMMQQPIPQNPYQYPIPDNTDFTNYDFSNPLPADQTYSDPTTFNNNNFTYDSNAAQQPAYGSDVNAPTSQELVRRSRNQQLAPQNGQQELWNGYSNNPTTGQDDDEDEAELERRVAAAKKDAQGKRKQIPPFVQKLSSFLDSAHTELIRWSDDGKSFIVLDEDEFARTLIPELFKHNNYASFVRQLNMYGFHKTVNITDGSLRQSEKARKGMKPPSMYSHPYFRRNRPDLLWLIQKPTAKSSSSKRKRDGKDGYDSDDGREFSPTFDGRPQDLGGLNSNQEIAQLPRNELTAVRQELQKLQNQQRFISQMITQLKEQNDQFYRQATAFQALHDRHETSINAILTFLATFYNRSLEGHGAANLVNMFTNAQNQQHQQQGSVVEEYNDGTPTPTSTQLQRFVKRPPLLLPGPTPSTSTLQPVTQPNSARQSTSPPGSSSHNANTPIPPASPAIKTEPPTPANDEMLNLLNSVNATAPDPAALDFSSMLDGNGTLANFMRQTSQPDGGGGSVPPTNFDPAHLHSSRATMETLQSMQARTAEQIARLSARLVPLSPSGSIPGLQHGGGSGGEGGGGGGGGEGGGGGLHGENGTDPFDSLGPPGEYDPSAFIDFGDPEGWGGLGDGDFDFGFDTSAPLPLRQGDGEAGVEEGGRVLSVSSGAPSPVDGTVGGKRVRRS